ncbi:N-acetyl-1-D-myo-inositol-2-amino-2-deoxy-alpha-D-glucopyranoside deacetylase [Streptomyces sp. HNM0574]|uniref:N-acetyl-1-D-myo-inositol-2-amino-2-deoxy-alpha- D-glucopyranoside deacetylase n=1 Tax=Streptomyces sp. HNM0574 TaxID=2714954 RepID=UPI00146E5FE7|nr:N-acetyl-1-D-myo-inositol-2-amino-2-deoxy-alpha-D-glucopyranoside deacetylase [Streptomyces sp. HNM0574]NLU67320.1 N-acetyl-1-D-myo-inositol-2-amino-2-deoxy-alpha-D-glucopyranoside deacetylase [Streptomyces sp. HNM0574]
MSTAPGRRLLLVHAHPDDESINNGATMAKYAAEGVHVTLVTCTLGEEGEVIPPELSHLAPDAPDTPDAPDVPDVLEAPEGDGITPLGRYRRDELTAAMRELGVTDHRLLGGAGRFRDSGMMGAATNERPRSFWRTPVDEAAAPLVQVIREVRPQVLVTYDPDGGYGHPDHIQAHRVAMRAVELAADPAYPSTRPSGEEAPQEPHTLGRVYWNCVPRAALAPGFAQLARAAEAGTGPFPGIAEPTDVPGLVESEETVDAVIDGTAYAGAKAAAMAAHATQVSVDGAFFALSNGLGQPLAATEYYRVADSGPGGATAVPRRPGAPAQDLFAEVDA